MLNDIFLSEILQMRCGVLDLNNAKDLAEIGQYDFVYSKTDLSTKNCIIASEHRFYLADVSVDFACKRNTDETMLKDLSDVVCATQENIPSILKIAKENFQHDRFHSDPNIDNKLASKIKEKWVSNFFEGKRGHNCFVCLADDGNPKGFLLTDIRNKKVFIDLIAVSKPFQGQGIGKKLIFSMFQYYRDSSLHFCVGTQLKNKNSITLYNKCGFELMGQKLVWHFFRENCKF